MGWITDSSGRRWVPGKPKARRAPRPLKRFAALEVGDQLMLPTRDGALRGGTTYYLVTDIWFDPCKGQDDPIKGTMIAVAQIDAWGIPGRKFCYAIRGLASNGMQYADMDYIGFCFARREAMAESGAVVPIGRGRQIRARPKTPGRGL